MNSEKEEVHEIVRRCSIIGLSEQFRAQNLVFLRKAASSQAVSFFLAYGASEACRWTYVICRDQLEILLMEP